MLPLPVLQQGGNQTYGVEIKAPIGLTCHKRIKLRNRNGQQFVDIPLKTIVQMILFANRFRYCCKHLKATESFPWA